MTFFEHLAEANCLTKPLTTNPNTFGKTKLHTAALICNHATVKCLLDDGAEVDAKDLLGRTPLMCLVYSEVTDCNDPFPALKILCEHNANLDAADYDGKTALHFAAERDDDEMVEELLALGASPNLPDHRGWTPLDSAVDAADPDVGSKTCELLYSLRHGAPFHHAVANRSAEIENGVVQ